MADLMRESPNLFDDLFKELEDWEEILKSLEGAPVGCSSNFPNPRMTKSQ